MISWYIEVSSYAPPGFNIDKVYNQIIENVTPCMNYFCNRLLEIEDWKIEDAEKVFGEIIEEMSIMNYRISGDLITGNKEFVIMYSRYINIKLTDTTKQIYREIKLDKILK